MDTSAVVRDERVYARRWWTLAVLALSLVIIGLDNTILNVALPTLQRTFDASAAELQWMVDAYILVFAGLLLTMGALGDRFGRARALQVGLAVFGVASLTAPLATEAVHLIAVRVAMGVGGALIMPATLSIIANVFPREERGRAIAIWAGMSGVGIGLGPLVGGLLLEQFAWSSVFLVNVPIAAVALVAGRALVPDSRDPEARPLDLPGAALSIGAVVAFVFAVIEAPAAGWTDPGILAAFAVAGGLAALFAWREWRTDAPMLDLTLFRERRFTAGALAIGLTFFALFAVIFGLTQYLQFVLGLTALEAGALLVVLALGMPLGAGISIRAVPRLGTKVVVSAALVGVASVLATITQWSAATDPLLVAGTLFVLAVCMANVMAPSTDAVMGAVPEAKAGVGSAMNDLVRQLGGALGVAIIGSVLNTVYRDRMAPVVDGLPAGVPAEALEAIVDSVGPAIAIAARVGGAPGEALAAAARVAFVDGLGVAVVVAVAVAIATSIFVAATMPARATHDAGQPRGRDVAGAAPAAG